MWTRQSLLGSIVTLALICGSVLFAILDKSFRSE